MMGNKKKQTFLVLGLFCLLAAIAATPLALLDYNSASLLDAYHTQLLAQSYDGEPTQAVTRDAFERLQLIAASVLARGEGVVSTFSTSLPTQEQQALVSTAEAQLGDLQARSVLPPLTLSDSYKLIYSKRSYMTTLPPYDSITIWNLQIAYEHMYVEVFMDAETQKLYDIYILFNAPPNAEGYAYGNEFLAPDEFLSYLQAASHATTTSFYSVGFYNEKSIHLYCESIDALTGETINYAFNSSDSQSLTEAAQSYSAGDSDTP